MKLHFRTFGEGTPLIILHGVFGSSDNWQTLGKVFAENYQVFLIDLRNHGNSPHSDEFNYSLMVEDVVELMDDQSIASCYMLGHSMGGKVAMHLATEFPERVDKLIVVDIAPKYYPPHHQQIFKAFNTLDLAALQSRKGADEGLSEIIENFGVRQFILKNLTRDDQGNFKWKLNVAAIENAVEAVGVGLEDEVNYTGNTLFIAGGNSNYIEETDHSAIQSFFPEAKIEVVPGAGHWVHAEKPQELSQVVLDFLA